MSNRQFDRKKRFHVKVRSGCLTCRKRRVKCDEGRPSCNNCYRNSLVCSGRGYGLPQTDDNASLAEDGTASTTWAQSALVPINRASLTTPANSDTSGSILEYNDDHSTRIPNSILPWTRVDPFDGFCVKSSPEDQRIFDHSIICQWSQFAPSQDSTELALVKKHVMSYVINNPVSYHSLLYAGACHRNFWEKSCVRSSEHDAELLWLKTRAIKAMREAIQQREVDVTDDLLIAALMLAVFDTGDKVKRRVFGKVQGRKALTYTLDAEFYAALDVEWRHLNVFYDLVERRGGILTMQPSALRTSAILFDIFNAYIHLTRPRMTALVPLSTTMAMRVWQPDDLATRTASKLGKGFLKVFGMMYSCPESAAVIQVIEGSILVMLDFDHIERSKRQQCPDVHAPDEQNVIWIRSMLLHELLMLPESFAPSTSEDEMPILIYEFCRLSFLMFCQLWLIADNNNNRRMARKQVNLLIPLLIRATSGADKLCEVLPDFYLWVWVLGVMLAYEDFDVSADETWLEAIAPFAAQSMVKTVPQAWTIVKDILPNFIWMWKDCNTTGQEAWGQVCRILSQT